MKHDSATQLTTLIRSAVSVATALTLTGCATALNHDQEVGKEDQVQRAGTVVIKSDSDSAANDKPSPQIAVKKTTSNKVVVTRLPAQTVPVTGATGSNAVAAAISAPVALTVVQDTQTQIATPDDQVPFVFVAGQQGRNTIHTPGLAFSVDVAVDKDASLYCYLLDEHKRVTQFFPNPLQKNPQIEAGTRMQFPGKFPFELIASQTGKIETITCIASTKSVGAVPLKDLPVASNVEQIHRSFADVAGPDVLFGIGVYDVSFN